jgi:dTDP-4-amino-4,6-dideoxygalactose transaminase
MEQKTLALLGGKKAVKSDPGDMFTWPIVTEEHEKAVLDMFRAGKMSGTDITKEFEREYAAQLGMKYAIGCNNGTAAIHCALYGLGVGVGDEVICPSLTYWASVAQVYSLCATPIFAEVDPVSVCIDPEDLEKRITSRTKVIVVVHYAAMPADMDAIMAVAEKHNVKVFEDASHAHASLYNGREVGTFGHASAFSLMSGKSLGVGEGGIMFTNDQRVHERALLFGHYARHSEIKLKDLKKYTGLPCGGYKYRMHQASSAFGRVQLKLYREEFAEIDKAMNYFCDLLEDIPGIKPIRPKKGSNCTKGGWYYPMAHYTSEELEGLSRARYTEAVSAEGSTCYVGGNKPLHTHPLFSEMDVYGHGKPTREAYIPEGLDIVQPEGSLPVTEDVKKRLVTLPWFRHYRKNIIEEHAEAFRKVSANYRDLLPGDKGEEEAGGYSTSFR